MLGYKGFDKELKCLNKQYEIGKTYTEDEARLCNSGMHFCENPLDCLDYYYMTNGSRYCEVEADDVTNEKDNDTKRVCKKLKIKAEIGLPGVCKAAVEYIKKQVEDVANTEETTQAASGDYSQLAASGDSSQLAASGDSSQLAASGDSSKLAASGYSSQLAASGDYSQLAASGYSSKLAASGYYSQLAASGDYSQLAASGDYSQLAASGDSSQLAASGDSSKLAVDGKFSVGCCVGVNCMAKGVKGSYLGLVEWGKDKDGILIPVHAKFFKVDGKKVKENVYYRLENKKLVEVDET